MEQHWITHTGEIDSILYSNSLLPGDSGNPGFLGVPDLQYVQSQ